MDVQLIAVHHNTTPKEGGNKRLCSTARASWTRAFNVKSIIDWARLFDCEKDIIYKPSWTRRLAKMVLDLVASRPNLVCLFQVKTYGEVAVSRELLNCIAPVDADGLIRSIFLAAKIPYLVIKYGYDGGDRKEVSNAIGCDSFPEYNVVLNRLRKIPANRHMLANLLEVDERDICSDDFQRITSFLGPERPEVLYAIPLGPQINYVLPISCSNPKSVMCAVCLRTEVDRDVEVFYEDEEVCNNKRPSGKSFKLFRQHSTLVFITADSARRAKTTRKWLVRDRMEGLEVPNITIRTSRPFSGLACVVIGRNLNLSNIYLNKERIQPSNCDYISTQWEMVLITDLESILTGPITHACAISTLVLPENQVIPPSTWDANYWTNDSEIDFNRKLWRLDPFDLDTCQRVSPAQDIEDAPPIVAAQHIPEPPGDFSWQKATAEIRHVPVVHATTVNPASVGPSVFRGAMEELVPNKATANVNPAKISPVGAPSSSTGTNAKPTVIDLDADIPTSQSRQSKSRQRPPRSDAKLPAQMQTPGQIQFPAQIQSETEPQSVVTQNTTEEFFESVKANDFSSILLLEDFHYVYH